MQGWAAARATGASYQGLANGSGLLLEEFTFRVPVQVSEQRSVLLHLFRYFDAADAQRALQIAERVGAHLFGLRKAFLFFEQLGVSIVCLAEIVRGEGLQNRDRLLNVAFGRWPLPQTCISFREIDVETRDFARFVAAQLSLDLKRFFVDRNRLLRAAALFKCHSHIAQGLGDLFIVRAMQLPLEIHSLTEGFQGVVAPVNRALCNSEV